MNQEKTPKELIEELYALFASFKTRMEDPNFIQIENTLSQLVESQQDMKRELKDLKKTLLDPNDGVIVATNKNTEFRQSREEREKEYNELIEEHKALVRFKSNATKFGVALLTALGGVITFFLNKYLGS